MLAPPPFSAHVQDPTSMNGEQWSKCARSCKKGEPEPMYDGTCAPNSSLQQSGERTSEPSARTPSFLLGHGMADPDPGQSYLVRVVQQTRRASESLFAQNDHASGITNQCSACGPQYTLFFWSPCCPPKLDNVMGDAALTNGRMV